MQHKTISHIKHIGLSQMEHIGLSQSQMLQMEHIGVSPDEARLPILAESPKQEHVHEHRIGQHLPQSGHQHPVAEADAPALPNLGQPVDLLDVERHVFVLDLECQHHEGDGEVAELDQFTQHEVEHGDRAPDDEADELFLAGDDEPAQEDDEEGVEQAEGILGPPEVAVDVEDVVPVVGQDEGVDVGALVDDDETGREQEEIGGEGMARVIDAVECFPEAVHQVADGDGQVDEQEKSEVKHLGGVEDRHMVLVVAEQQPPVVVAMQVPQEEREDQHLRDVLLHDRPHVGQHHPGEPQQAFYEVALDGVDGRGVIHGDAIQQQVPAPDDVVLAHEDREQGGDAHAPHRPHQAVVERHGHEGQADRVSVVQEVEEEESGSQGQVEAAHQVVAVVVLQVVDLHREHCEQAPEQQACERPQPRQAVPHYE